MEIIKNISIKNFKSINELEINNCNKVNVFIGYPNVGKSNILEALSLISCHTNLNNIQRFVRYKSFFNLYHSGNINQPIEICLNNNLKLLINESNLNNISLNYSKIFENEDIYKPFSPTTNINYNNIKKYQFVNNISYNNNENVNYLANPNGENLLKIFQINNQLRKEAAEIFKMNDLKLNIDIEKNEIRVQKNTSEDTILSIPYNLMADTIQRLLFYSAAILSNKNSILLFEEPEAQLFPPYIKKLTYDILNDQGNNQFFINTHSPYVLNNILENSQGQVSVYIVYHNGSTKVKNLSDKEKNEILEYDIDLFYNLESFIK